MIYDLLELAAELLAGTLCASIVVGGTLPLMVAARDIVRARLARARARRSTADLKRCASAVASWR